MRLSFKLLLSSIYSPAQGIDQPITKKDVARFIYIPLLKWVMNLTVMILVFGYIFPTATSKWFDLAIGWSLSLPIAMLFAYWTCQKFIPYGKSLALMIVSWVFVTAIMEIVLGYYKFFELFATLFRYEFAVQMLIEIVGILIMVKVMRRQRAYQLAAEGINLES